MSDPEPLRDFRAARNKRDAQAKSEGAKRRSEGAKPRSKGAQRRSPPPPPAPTATEPVDGGGSLRRLSTPRPIAVRPGDRGVPAGVESQPVEAVLEEWVVEDRWWSGMPVRRRYFELVLVNGRNVVVFKDLVGGRWFAQRA
ncbi:MAG: hypothetical protein QOJ12_1087 [Thermoleophilales bacterium]|nr:hypothetical protein [Thermoleophilales bacterium]